MTIKRTSHVTARDNKIVDLVLGALHAADVFLEGCVLSGASVAGLHAQETGNILLVDVVSADTLFDVTIELPVELGILLGLVLRLLLQELDETAGQHTRETLDEGRVLQMLTRQVERNILGVHNTLDEAEPVGKKSLTLVRANQNDYYREYSKIEYW